MNKRTLTALRGSIKKWEAIVEGNGAERGTYNCPLCKVFHKGDCKGCPVVIETGLLACDGTPYEDWAHFIDCYHLRTINKMPPEYRTKARKLAQAELDFLRSLLPGKEKL